MKILICLFFITSTSFAFNSDRCYSPDNYKGGWQFSGFTSSTQFTSSFGGCSALGQAEIAKRYIVSNESDIKQEIAIGRGEYLLALNESMNCPKDRHGIFNKALQHQMTEILPLTKDVLFLKISQVSNEICNSRR